MTDPHSRSFIVVQNLNVKVETVSNVTYPHHIFGPGSALVDSETGMLLLPGMNGEVFVSPEGTYNIERIDSPE